MATSMDGGFECDAYEAFVFDRSHEVGKPD